MLKRVGDTPIPDTPETAPPRHLESFPVVLNSSWRVVDDSPQWILESRNSKPRKNDTGWRGRSFCRTREALLRCVNEYCGIVEAEEMKRLEALPDFHD